MQCASPHEGNRAQSPSPRIYMRADFGVTAGVVDRLPEVVLRRTLPHSSVVRRKGEQALRAISHRNFNHIGVRSFILYGAP